LFDNLPSQSQGSNVQAQGYETLDLSSQSQDLFLRIVHYRQNGFVEYPVNRMLACAPIDAQESYVLTVILACAA